MATASLELVPQSPTALAEYTEQNVSMVQQLAQAQIQSAYVMSERHPRDFDVIEAKILKECKRPQFCAIDPDPKKYGSSLAMYGVPRGGQYNNGQWVPNIIRDLTIRFAEMALPLIKNVSVDLWPMGEDDNQRVFRAVRIDYESNVAEGEIIVVPKTVERRRTKDTDYVLSQRTNSDGKPVYIIRATAEEMDTAKRAQYSKVKRNLILSMLPGWLKEAAKEEIRTTQRTVDAIDPDTARKRLFAAFAVLGVSIEDVKAYIGHSNDLTPAEIETMRVIYAGISEGQTTWKAVLAAKEEGGDEDLDTLIAAEFEKLEIPPAQIRKTKAKYVGRGKELLEWLTAEVAKKRNDGSSKKTEEKKTDPEKEAAKHAKAAQAENPDAEPPQDSPDPVEQSPTPTHTSSAPPPIEEDAW
jgi:hypothetical protein